MVRSLFPRLLRILLTLLLGSIMTFLAVRVLPGDAAAVIAGVEASSAERTQLRARLGLDRPLWAQYLSWIAAAVRLDLGYSRILGAPVAQLIAERLPITLLLACGGLTLALALGLPLGVRQAERAGGLTDRLGAVYGAILMALPEFWIAILLLLLLAVHLRLFPLFGIGSPRHFVLPIVAMGLTRSAPIARIARAAALQAIDRPYVAAARARGLPRRRIRVHYIARAALVPVVTLSAIQFGYLIGGGDHHRTGIRVTGSGPSADNGHRNP